jgi:branched-chain amino acid transport system permease protein
MQWLNALVQGVLLGGVYALLAAGLSLIFGVMRIVNLAHGALAVAAAYIGLAIVQATGVSPFLAILGVIPVMAGLGYALQWGIFTRAMSQGGLSPLLAAFGLAVVITQLLQVKYTADSRSLPIGSLAVKSIRINEYLSIGVLPLITFGTAVVVIAILQLFISKAPLGRAMRAASDDPDIVGLMGIDNRQVYALATAIALGITGLAGMFVGMRGSFDPYYGQAMLIFAFEAVIIGGLGSLWGTLVGGLVLGIAQAIGAQIDPSYGVLIGHLVFLTVLAFRPTGLLPRSVTT